MSRSLKGEDRLVQYLLGLMPDAEKLKLEEEYLHDDSLNEEIQAMERELIDRYLDEDLSGIERTQFETFFLRSPNRRDRLRFAKSFRTYGARLQSTSESAFEPAKAIPAGFFRTFGGRYVGAAAFAVLIIAIGFVIWRVFIYRSADQQAMIALASGYKAGRLLTPRISGLPYAPGMESRGDTGENLEFKKAELIATTEVTDHGGSRSYHVLGRVYLVEQKFAEALQALRSAEEQAPNDASIQSDLGVALLEHARSESDEAQAQEMTESLDHFNRALKLDELLLEARFNRALCNERMHLLDEARADWQAYLQRDGTSGWADEARKHLAQLDEKKTGSNQIIEKEFEAYIAALSSGDDQTAWSKFSRNRDRVHNRMMQRLVDQYLEAAAHGDASIAAEKIGYISRTGRLEFEKCGDRFSSDLANFYQKSSSQQREAAAQARALFRSASQSYTDAEYERAAQFFEEAGRQFDGAGDSCEALGARFWIAGSLLRSNGRDRAASILKELRATSTRRDYKLLLAHSLLAMFDANIGARAFSKGTEKANPASDLLESIGDVNGRLRSLQAPADVSYSEGRFYGCIALATRALDLAETFHPEPRDVWTFYQLIASSYSDLRMPEMALPFQSVSNQLALDSGARLLRSRSYAIQAVILGQLRRYDEALASGQRALAEAEAVGGERTRKNMIANSTLMLGHVNLEAGAFDRAAQCFDRAIELHKSLNINLYLPKAHNGKLQALIGMGDDEAIKQELSATIAVLEQDRANILEDENRDKYFDLYQSTYDLAIEFEYSHLADERAAFEYSELSHARSLQDLMVAGGEVIADRNRPDLRADSVAPPLSLNEIQQRLPENAQILQYSVLRDGLIAWVISRTSPIRSFYQKIPATEIDSQANEFARAVSAATGSDYPEVTKRGMSLYKLLIEPAKPLLNANATIFIVPDKALNYVPFGALVSPTSGNYFVQDYLFALSPSSSIMLRCSERAAAKASMGEEKLLAAGNPTFDRAIFRSLSDLPSAEKEVRSIADLYASPAPLVLTGAAASARALRAAMDEADVLQIATHYVADSKSPLLSKLVLAKSASGSTGSESALTVVDIYRLNLSRPRLVVLSACGTGIERAYKGEGAIGIARPFIKAGALVLASLWPVESEPTCELMIDFHKRRKLDRLDSIRALRQAQIDMINQANTEAKNPRNWAAFTAIGGYTRF